MKKMGQNIVIFIVFLGIAYFQPVFFPFSDSKQEKVSQLTTKTEEEVATPKRLKTEGLAKYIGKNSLSLKKEYGLPVKSFAVGDITWYLYEKQGAQLQVGVQNHRIVDMLVFGSKADVAPFKIGMSLNELAPHIELLTSFQLTSQGKTYHVDISEDNLVNTPFVSFKNDSEAFLQFHHQGKLEVVYYASTPQFLQNMPYRLSAPDTGDAGRVLSDETKKEEAQHQALVQQTWQSLLKEKVVLDPALNEEARQLLLTLQKNMSDYIEDKQLEEWQHAFQGKALQQSFTLPEDMVKRLSDKPALVVATNRSINVELVHQFYDLNANKILAQNRNIHIGLSHKGDVWFMIVKENET